MAKSARAGHREKNDAFVEISDRGVGPTTAVTIESPVRELFGEHQDRAVRETLEELDVRGGELRVSDQQALDFVLRSRVRAAVERLRKKGGRV